MARVGILETDARSTPTITTRLTIILGIYRYLLARDAPKSTARAATLDDRPFPSSLTSIPHHQRTLRDTFRESVTERPFPVSASAMAFEATPIASSPRARPRDERQMISYVRGTKPTLSRARPRFSIAGHLAMEKSIPCEPQIMPKHGLSLL